MNAVKANYFDAYRSRKLTRDATGVLVAEFHSKGGPFPLPRSEKSGQSCATHGVKSALVVCLTSGKDGEIEVREEPYERPY